MKNNNPHNLDSEEQQIWNILNSGSSQPKLDSEEAEIAKILGYNSQKNAPPAQPIKSPNRLKEALRGIPTSIDDASNLASYLLNGMSEKEYHEKGDKLSNFIKTGSTLPQLLPFKIAYALKRQLEQPSKPYESRAEKYDRYFDAAEPTDTLGKVLQGGVGAAVPWPGGGLGQAAKLGTKALSKVVGRDLLGGFGSAAAVEMAPKITKKDSKGRIVEDLIHAVAGGASANKLGSIAGRRLNKPTNGAPEFSNAERKVQQHLVDIIGEENVPDVVRNIEQNNVPGNFVEGYKPTTAEVANSGPLAAKERSLMGLITSPEYSKLGQRVIEQNNAILKKINSMVPDHYTADMASDFVQNQYNKLSDSLEYAKAVGGDEAAEKVMQNFLHTETPQEAGRQIQRRIGDELMGPHEEALRAQGATDYNAVNQSGERRVPTHTQTEVNERLRNAKGKLRRFLESVGRDLESHDNEFIDVGGVPQRVPPRIGELEGLKQSLKDEASTVVPGSPRQAHIMALMDALDRDLANAAPVRNARENYARLSEPLNQFTEHPHIGKDVARDRFRDFTKNPGDVIEKYIKGSKSVEYARDLLQHIQGDRQAMSAVEGHINSEFIKHVIDGETGLPKKSSLESFRKEYPGAFILDPRLETKLANSSNATKYYHDTVRENTKAVKDFERNAAYKFLKQDPNTVSRSIIESNNSRAQMKEVVTELAKDKSKNALPGFQRSFTEHLMTNFKTLGEGNTNLSIAKFDDLMNNKKEALEVLFNPEQMNALEQVHRTLLSRNKKYTINKELGSRTATTSQNLLGEWWNNSLNKFKNTTWGDIVMQGLNKIGEIKNRKYNEALVKVVMDPDFAKLMLTNIEGKSPKEVNKMISNYVKNSAIKASERISRREEEKKEE